MSSIGSALSVWLLLDIVNAVFTFFRPALEFYDILQINIYSFLSKTLVFRR